MFKEAELASSQSSPTENSVSNQRPVPSHEIQADGPVAVLVCHGMGQQVKFSTISAVAEAIILEAKAEGAAVEPVQVHLSEANACSLVRAEVGWRDKDTGRPHEVHVYEAYWAPVTEGKVTYIDTILFLFQAARNGFKYSKPFFTRPFQRWMFGKKNDLPIWSFTWFALLGVLLFLLLQVSVIAFVTLELARQYKDIVAHPVPARDVKAFFQWVAPLFPGIQKIVSDRLGTRESWIALGWLFLWLAAIAEAYFARYFLIQYVGDVAAYISPYKDSKFEDVRERIQKIGLNVGKAVYGLDNSGIAPGYKKFVVIGHSLGSVVAYDTLNALINADELRIDKERRGVLEHTRAMITFGSPLDKTAFLFRSQARKEEDWIREQLAARVQPLIYDEAHRPETFTWVNIWSPLDIISGSIEYYDDPKWSPKDSRHVQNIKDPDANVPLAAHVQYWGNRLLRQQIYQYVR